MIMSRKQLRTLTHTYVKINANIAPEKAWCTDDGRHMELISACAKQNRSSKTKYRKVWRALVSCTEGVLASGRGVIVEKVRINDAAEILPLTRSASVAAELVASEILGCASTGMSVVHRCHRVSRLGAHAVDIFLLVG